MLVWNTNDPANNQPADRVIGQPSFSDAQGCTSGRLCTPASVSVLGNRLYITENSSHRVLSWPSLSPADGEPPDRVFGQPDVSTSAPNLGRFGHRSTELAAGPAGHRARPLHRDAGNGRVVVLPPDRAVIARRLPGTSAPFATWSPHACCPEPCPDLEWLPDPERSLPCLDSDRCEPLYVTAPFVLGKPDGDSNAYTHGQRSPIG